MRFSWRFLLRIAVTLLTTNPEEAERRTAINRAYYAALGEAREFAISHGLVMNRRRPSHDQIWQFLRNGGSGIAVHRRAAMKAIGDDGVTLRAMRVQADYKLDQAPTEGEARQASQIADRIVRRLHGL